MADEKHEDLPEELIEQLRAEKPEPDAAFAEELDRRVAEGFPKRESPHGDEEPGSERTRRGRLGGALTGWLAGIREKVGARGLRPLPALGVLGSACAVALALVVAVPQLDSPDRDAAVSGGGSESAVSPGGGGAASEPGADGGRGTDGAAALNREGRTARDPMPSLEDSSANADRAAAPGPANRAGMQFGGGLLAPGVDNRRIERTASLVLATDSGEVEPVASRVHEIAGRHGVIVRSASTDVDAERGATARFSLMVPSGRLGSVLTEISDLAEVRERRDSSLDITGPTVSAVDNLREARADVEGLLDRLSEADDEDEREQIRRELGTARSRLAMHRADLERMRTRAEYANVDLTVLDADRAGPAAGSGSWSIGDAFDDAVRVLTVTAGVALIATAALLPVALLILILAYARRFYVERRREQALR